MMKRKWQCLTCCSLLALLAACAVPRDPGVVEHSAMVGNRFALVLMDAEAERQFGEFPLDRKIIAQGVKRLADLHPKGLVLKFLSSLLESN